MAVSLVDQLATLQRQRQSLEQILMLDANWRALRQLDEREATGEPLQAVDGAALRAQLEAVLSVNRLYAARAKIIEAIGLLDGSRPPDMLAGSASSQPGGQLGGQLGGRPLKISSRIVLLADADNTASKNGVKLQPAAVSEQPSDAAPSMTAPAPAALPEPAIEPPPIAPSLAEIATTIGSLAAAIEAQPHAQCDEPDRLALIAGLDADAIGKLQEAGVTSFAAIAAATSFQTRDWRARLGGDTGTWIEQAAILAEGRDTAHAASLRRRQFSGTGPIRPTRILAAEPMSSAVAYTLLSPPPAAVIPLAPLIISIDVVEPPGSGLAVGLPIDAAPSDEELPAVRWRRAFDRRGRGQLADAVNAAAPTPPGRGLGQGLEPAPARATPVPDRPAPAAVAMPDDGAAELGGADHEADIEIRVNAGVEAMTSQTETVERVEMVAPEAADEPDDAPASGSLRQRLHKANPPPTFNRHSYAAYYDEVEEASVSIVRPDEDRVEGRRGAVSAAPDAPPRRTRAASAPGRVDRFLKALTGKG